MSDQNEKKNTEPKVQARYGLIVTDIIAVFREHKLTFEETEMVLGKLDEALQYLKEKNPI